MAEIRLPKINNLMISGYVTREVELNYTPANVAVARIGIAFTESYNKGDEWIEDTSFFTVKAFGKTAEIAAEKIHKGSPIVVEGSIRSYSYTDKEQNQKTGFEIKAFKIQALEKTNTASNSTNNEYQPEDVYEKPKKVKRAEIVGDKYDVENDVPF